MSFTSSVFLLFCLLFMAVWPAVRNSATPRWATIAVASFVFYGWWDWRFLFLLIGTGLLDFAAALVMERWRSRALLLLWISILINIGSIALFKYTPFAADQLRTMLGMPATQWDWTHQIVLPVGISFYTFQSLSYTIDVYRGELKAIRNPLHFFAFLVMFPQLVAGPIVRAADLLPQLATPGHFNAVNRLDGLQRATWGFVKKLVIADNLAPVVNAIFAQESVGSDAALWWLGAALFGIQIFADFSGYSDIACGIAMWMGYRFPDNFLQPYAARGFRDFWARWHISLSTWFRDYVYIPLGGSRQGALRTTWNQSFTLVISGLWHGANWTFLLWGAMHALFLALERLVVSLLRGTRVPCGGALAWALTMVGVLMGWVVFRANSIEQAAGALRIMLIGTWSIGAALDRITPLCSVGLLVGALGAITWAIKRGTRSNKQFKMPVAVRSASIVLGIVAAVYLRGSGGDFIYFQF